MCARFRSQTHCSQRQFGYKGCLNPSVAGIRPKHTSSHWFNKNSLLYSLLHCNRSNNRQSWAASQDFGQPKNFEDQCESHPKFKTLQTLLWDLAAVGREPCFFPAKWTKENKFSVSTEQCNFQIIEEKKKTLANKCRQRIASNVHDAHLQFSKDKNNKEQKKENIKAAHTAKHCSLKLWSIHASSATWEQESNNYVLKAGSFKATETFLCNKSLGEKKTLLKWKKNRQSSTASGGSYTNEMHHNLWSEWKKKKNFWPCYSIQGRLIHSTPGSINQTHKKRSEGKANSAYH